MEHRRAARRGTPRKGVDPGDELGEAERLGEVIVGAERQPVDHVLERPGGGEHQDPRLRPLVADGAADLVAVQARAGRDRARARRSARCAPWRAPDSPSAARSTAIPCRRSPRAIASASRTSSSAISTRTTRGWRTGCQLAIRTWLKDFHRTALDDDMTRCHNVSCYRTGAMAQHPRGTDDGGQPARSQPGRLLRRARPFRLARPPPSGWCTVSAVAAPAPPPPPAARSSPHSDWRVPRGSRARAARGDRSCSTSRLTTSSGCCATRSASSRWTGCARPPPTPTLPAPRPHDLLTQADELGLTMIGVPEELGGAVERALGDDDGADEPRRSPAATWASPSPAWRRPPSRPRSVCGATPTSRRPTCLPFVCEDIPAAALALMEPEPLFDPFALGARARSVGGGYVLDGVKALVPRAADGRAVHRRRATAERDAGDCSSSSPAPRDLTRRARPRNRRPSRRRPGV